MAEPNEGTKTITQEDYDGVLKELTRVRNEKRDLESKVVDLSKRFDTLESEKLQAEDAKAQAELEEKGKYDEALNKVKQTYNTKLAELTAQLKDKDGRIEAMMIDGKILELADNAVNPAQAVVLLKSVYRFAVKDNAVTITTADGQPVLDGKGQAMTIEAAYDNFMTDNPHLAKPGTTQGGSNNRVNSPSLKGTHTSDIDSQIAEAQKAGNRTLVVKLKAQKMSLQGPHASRTQVT